MVKHPLRVAPLQGATNFRDLGGYVGHEGRRVRWRLLFRSDHLASLSPEDLAHLSQLGLKRSIDFRGVHERAAQPYTVPGVEQLSLSIEPSVIQRMDQLMAAGRGLTAETMAELMRDLYRRLINEQSHRFAELFAHLLAPDSTPVVFHCTAGKDRTGVAAALILLALGVSHSDVMADYLLTNEVFQHPPMAVAPPMGSNPPPPAMALPPEALAVLWRVQADFLAETLRVIEAEHGGLERYLHQRMGLDPARREALRERYLDEVPQTAA